MSSLPLAAQQTLLASAGSYSAHFSTSAPDSIFAPLRSSFAVEVTESASGLAPDTTLYDLALGPAPDGVCIQLLPGEPVSDYAFDRAQFTAAALKASFSHDNVVKMARNFVPGQPLPDAPEYHPLTTKQKFDAFLRNSHSVGTGLNIFSDAVVAQVTHAYPRLDGGMAGFSERLAISGAGAETAAFIGGFVYPTLFHQDPRFFPSHQHGIFNRLAYAASRAFIGRSDNGFAVINSSVIASQFTEAAIANAYVPYRSRSASGTVENALTGLGGVAEGHILDEFWPDIKEFVWRHTHNELIRRGMSLGDPAPQQAYH